jgi:hypothetical protein
VITYAERVCFRDLHLRLRSRVESHVARVSSSWGNELRCHELARAIQLVEGEHDLELFDGKCGPIEHSWLRFSDGVILDPYAPGRLPAVQIVDPIVGVAYQPADLRNDIRQSIVALLVREMGGEA